jgi:hypothetical protein
MIACQSVPSEIHQDVAGELEPPPGKGTAWKINWHRSSRQIQESLIFLSLAFTLRRAVELVDLKGIREVLKRAAESDLLEHPLFIQALEMLERIDATEKLG